MKACTVQRAGEGCRVQRVGEGCRVQRAKAFQEDAADIRERNQGGEGNQYWEKPREMINFFQRENSWLPCGLNDGRIENRKGICNNKKEIYL